MTGERTRRGLLRAGGALAATALAGCSGDGRTATRGATGTPEGARPAATDRSSPGGDPTDGQASTAEVTGETSSAAGTAEAEADAWPMYGHDAANTRYNPGGVAPADDVTVAWTTRTEGAPAAVAVAGDAVFVTDSERLFVLDASTGEERRDLTRDHREWPVAVAGNTVYYAVGEPASIVAETVGTGEQRWQTAIDGRPSPVTVAGDTVYLVGGSGTFAESETDRVYALAAASGEQRWVTETTDLVAQSVAVAGGAVYAIGRERLAAFDARSGARRWARDFDLPVWGPPAVADGRVAICVGRHVRALAPADGAEQWRFGADDPVLAGPCVAADALYVGSDDENLYALDPRSGEERWRAGLGHPVRRHPAVGGETLYVDGEDGLVALDAGTGRARWRRDVSPAATPAVTRGRVYVPGEEYAVRALSTAD